MSASATCNVDARETVNATTARYQFCMSLFGTEMNMPEKNITEHPTTPFHVTEHVRSIVSPVHVPPHYQIRRMVFVLSLPLSFFRHGHDLGERRVL